MIRFDELESDMHQLPKTRIKVIGVGGAGCNTINSMIGQSTSDIDFLAVNTDAQSLSVSKACAKLQIGMKATKGLGSGANPELGKKAAEEDLEKITQLVGDCDMVFLTGGLGGGTGSGALPVFARILKQLNILTVCLVSRPFVFEGKRRAKIAQDAYTELHSGVDTLLVIPNQKLLDVVGGKPTLLEAFEMVNQTISGLVFSISDIITRPGHINVDFADIKTIMKNMGSAIMGTGSASGEDRCIKATMQAINSPLLENMDIVGAKSILISIKGNENLGLDEVSRAASIIYEKAHEDANIILGSVIDSALGDQMSVTVIATGFDHALQAEAALPRAGTLDTMSVQKTMMVSEIKKDAVPMKIAAMMCDQLDIPAIMRQKQSEQQL